MTTQIKVLTKHADAIMDGTKTFEIHKNDRGFKVGDKIVFEVLANEGYDGGGLRRARCSVHRIRDSRRIR